jgi:putative hydrolase of the HAD superfamily
MAISALIFDLGNVVLTNDNVHGKIDEFLDYFKISEDNAEKGWHAFWPDYKIGKITEEQFWEGFLKTAGAKKIDTDAAKRIYRKYQKQLEEMFSLLRRLKPNYKVAVLTNIGKEWLDFKISHFKLKDIFDVIVGSGHSGKAKPDIEIYKTLLKKLNVIPQECLYIDDKEKCLVPARELGMKTSLFTSQAQLEKDLRKRNIKF